MSKRVPQWPLRLFRWFCDPEFADDIEGDLLERFEKRRNQGKPAKRLLVLDVLKLVRPGIIRKLEGSETLNHYGLLRHNFISTLRSFRKEKSFAFINLLGLSTAMVVGLLIGQFIFSEKAVDSYPLNASNKYRVNYNYYENEELVQTSALTTYGLGTEAVENFPGIRNMVRIRPIFSDEGLVVSSKDNSKKFLEYGAFYVEKSFLQFFNYPVALGNRSTALAQPNQIVLTNQSVKKFFEGKNPIGESLKISGGNLSGDFIVSAVLEKLPNGTQFDFDYLIPIDFMLNNYGIYKRENGWQWENFYTFFEFEETIEKVSFAQEIDDLVHRNIGHNLAATNQELKTNFQPIADIYLDAFIDGDGGLNKGNALNLNVYLMIGLVILLVAGINYVNLASARAIQKRQQVSIKKAIGASRKQVLLQFLSESFTFNLLSFAIALLLAYLMISPLNSLLNKSMTFGLVGEPTFWIGSSCIILLLSVLTGLYPGLLGLRIADYFKKSIKPSLRTGGITLKKSLLGFQLVASIVLVAGTWLVFSQLSYMKNQELGVSMEQLFVFQGPRVGLSEGHEMMKIKRERFKKSLLENPSIQAVTASSNVPGTGEMWYGGVRKLGDPRNKEVETEAIFVDKDFTNTYDFEFLAGKAFHRGMSNYEAVIINESALRSFGLQQPSEALGHSVVLEDLDTLKIQGVVKDIHWNSLQEPVSPMIFGIVDYAAFFTVKVNTADLPATIEFVQDTYNEHYPEDPYLSFFLDEEFDLQYQSEQQFGQIFSLLALIAIIISGMGLFSLIAFSLSQKMKEIGIRKVLGASGRHLFQLLSKEYFFIFIIAAAISAPIIFIGAEKWLEEFAYRTSTGIELLLLPSLLVATLTFLVVSLKVLNAMQTNPVDHLRDE